MAVARDSLAARAMQSRALRRAELDLVCYCTLAVLAREFAREPAPALVHTTAECTSECAFGNIYAW